ncbi:MAG: ERF family protein [Romboutsia sp.]|nr:ERF family protein [Romboutsia sp.]
MANIYEKLMNVQQELKAPKNQYNSFGEYKYRSCEDILEAVKPLLKKNKLTLQINDTIVPASESRFYIKATAKLIDVESEATIENTAFAREVDDKKKLDGSQLTGVSSSYARKYALNGLFLIDDTKDADTDEFQKQTSEEKFVTKAQIKKLGELVDDIPAMLNYYKVDKIENLRYEDAKKTIERKENAIKREDS